MLRSPVSDLFGTDGRAWLAEQRLGIEEAETVAGCLRQIDFLAPPGGSRPTPYGHSIGAGATVIGGFAGRRG